MCSKIKGNIYPKHAGHMIWGTFLPTSDLQRHSVYFMGSAHDYFWLFLVSSDPHFFPFCLTGVWVGGRKVNENITGRKMVEISSKSKTTHLSPVNKQWLFCLEQLIYGIISNKHFMTVSHLCQLPVLIATFALFLLKGILEIISCAPLPP